MLFADLPVDQANQAPLETRVVQEAPVRLQAPRAQLVPRVPRVLLGQPPLLAKPRDQLALLGPPAPPARLVP